MQTTLVPLAQLALAIEYQRAYQLVGGRSSRDRFLSIYLLGFSKGYTEASNR